jgi:uracil-DNA glycosylase family 4
LIGEKGGGPREELSAIAAGLRAYASWQMDTGATGVPRGSSRGSKSKETARSTAVGGRDRAAPAAAEAGPEATAARRDPADVPAAQEARRLRLVELAGEVRGCQKCALSATRTQTVFARGNPAAELCFVGEGPGADEDAQGEPFVGKAGQLLDRMIAAMGFSRDDVYVCNIVKCRPPNNRKPEPVEMVSCAPFLTEQLALVAPKVIVALGGTAVEGLFGPVGGITRIRGQWKVYRSVPVMPTFHPAYLLRNPPAKREAWLDLQAVLKQMGRSVPERSGR